MYIIKRLELKSLKSNLCEFRILTPLEKLSKMKIIKTAVLHTVDLAKDSIFLMDIAYSVGGIAYLMDQEEPYIRGVRLF